MPAFQDIAKTFTTKELPDSEVEISGEIPAEVVATYHDRALAHVAEHIDLPGFRKGHVPADIALKKVGEIAVLEEAVEMALRDIYPAVLIEHKVDAVGQPDVRITKLAPGNPVSIVITAAVYPKVVLPQDWKQIHTNIALIEAEPATVEEVEKTVESLRQSRKTKAEDGTEVVPELTDEFAKTLGAFADLAALREQVTKGITEEKARTARDARRGKIIDAVLDKTTVAIPKIFVESELDKIMAQMQEDITRFNMNFDDYLKRVGKTVEEVRNEFREQATKRAKLQLTLNAMADAEKISADEEAVEAEMKHAIEHFPEARPDLVKVHIETVLRNEKTLKLLEGNETEVKSE
jgi:FKBP-type peptidyl-prolyl cis-trans isomerase (trigger factor)